MRYRISFEIEVPDIIPEEDVIEWARFRCHDNGVMKNSNPLVNEDIEPIFPGFECEPV